jgi:Protein of unknown function (DUF3311)
MKSGSEGSGRLWYILLLIPFVATLWVPFYASAEPSIAGIPYFYWYQFLWVPISAGLTAVVYFATREHQTPPPASPPASPKDRR